VGGSEGGLEVAFWCYGLRFSEFVFGSAWFACF
jgi:hypothetical protein